MAKFIIKNPDNKYSWGNPIKTDSVIQANNMAYHLKTSYIDHEGKEVYPYKILLVDPFHNRIARKNSV